MKVAGVANSKFLQYAHVASIELQKIGVMCRLDLFGLGHYKNR